MSVLTFLCSVGVQAQSQLLAELLQAADTMQLHERADWLNLLHYKSHVFGGVYSQVDDERFFLASNGHHDARAELIASLTAFLAQDHPARCRFPARFHWLDSQLHFAEQLPPMACSDFALWRQQLNAQRITLVFPTMYLNNPASMFGHTFLRLDQPDIASLLSYTLSYGARTDPDDNALQYVVKGLAGGYTGVFSVQPYYETVQAYGDIEHRDIWEYTLNLNADEVEQLLRHAWELRNIDFDYYFLRENCSYRLLSLLDVARPGSNMTHEHLPVYALPVDTVRLVEQAGLIQASHYRPAVTSRLEQMHQQLDTAARVTVQTVVQQDRDWLVQLEKFSVIEQARILDMASEWRQSTESEDGQAAHAILLARSRLAVATEDRAFVFRADNPLQSHATARAAIAYGEHEDLQYAELAWRPVFHDLLDDVTGFVPGAAISVLDTRLRWYEASRHWRLQQLDLFSLTSLVPVRPWSHPLSAKLSVNITHRLLEENHDGKLFNMDMGLGYSAQAARVLFYAMADFGLEYSKKLQHNHVLYAGAETGALFTFDDSRMRMSVLLADHVSGQDVRKEVYRWQYQYRLAPRHALHLEYKTTIQFIRDSDFSLGYYHYF